MQQKKFHPRNKHQSRYNFKELIAATPDLKLFLKIAPNGNQTINFHAPKAVKMLNRALLKQQYQIEFWDIPDGYLCPPIPGRADYLHYVADLLATENDGKIPKGKQTKCLDIGVGANCIYPILGSRIYGWEFIGADIEEQAIASAQKNIDANSILKNKIELRLQIDSNAFFKNILSSDERVDLTVCNPPFHTSAAEARKGTIRKLKNLKGSKNAKPTLNFGGQSNELWTKGGERKFIQKMIFESADFAPNCLWFSTLVSKEANLKPIESTLKKAKVVDFKTIPMSHGNKVSRIVAWTFLTKKQRQIWSGLRWK